MTTRVAREERKASMIIDFHVHVLPPADLAAFTATQFHRNIKAPKQGRSPTTIENALKAAEIGGIDITVISNPLHNLRDMDRKQQLERCQRQNRFNAECQAKYPSIIGMASTVPWTSAARMWSRIGSRLSSSPGVQRLTSPKSRNVMLPSAWNR